jgi:hypothetical protein
MKSTDRPTEQNKITPTTVIINHHYKTGVASKHFSFSDKNTQTDMILFISLNTNTSEWRSLLSLTQFYVQNLYWRFEHHTYPLCYDV